MAEKNLEIFYPRYVTLADGRRVLIDETLSKNEELFALLVPIGNIDKIAKHLTANEGFTSASPAIPKGEKYSLSRIISHPWELHIRLFERSPLDYFGSLYAHVEVSREYFEHLSFVQPVIYEPFEYYRMVYPQFHVYSNIHQNWISSIDENYRYKLKTPQNLTEWKPVVTTVAVTGIILGVLYAIDKLTEPKRK